MSDQKLRNKLIRLAHSNPEIRNEILPLLKEGSTSKEAGSFSFASFMEKMWDAAFINSKGDSGGTWDDEGARISGGFMFYYGEDKMEIGKCGFDLQPHKDWSKFTLEMDIYFDEDGLLAAKGIPVPSNPPTISVVISPSDKLSSGLLRKLIDKMEKKYFSEAVRGW